MNFRLFLAQYTMKDFNTKAIRTQIDQTQHKEHSSPLFITSSFDFDNAEDMRAAFADEKEANIYSRFSNPNAQELIDKMCALEQTEAGFATASGMAAIFASFMTFLNAGDHLVACRSIFGSTHTVITKYLPKWGIEYSYFDVNKPEELEGLIKKNTKMVFVESPTNPGLDILDIEYVAKVCKSKEVLLNVDNCFATPYLQQPAKLGADIVTHSATKFIDGQGRVLGGLVLGKEELIKEVFLFSRSTGPSISPFNAWVLSKSLETLSLRMDKHCENSLRLALYLNEHPQLKGRVKYPGLPDHPQFDIAKMQMKAGGGIVTFDLPGGVEQGRKFMDALKMCSLTANLGDTKTIASHPSSTTHSKLTDEERATVGITPGLVRLSVGLEDLSDIMKDVEQALEKSK